MQAEKELKQIEEELKESKRKYELLNENK